MDRLYLKRTSKLCCEDRLLDTFDPERVDLRSTMGETAVSADETRSLLVEINGILEAQPRLPLSFQPQLNLGLIIDGDCYFFEIKEGLPQLLLEASHEGAPPQLGFALSSASLKWLIEHMRAEIASKEAVQIPAAFELDAEVSQLLEAFPHVLEATLKDGESVLAQLSLVPSGAWQKQLDTSKAAIAASECQIELDLDALNALKRKESDPFTLFASGRVRIQGKAELALAYGSLLS